MLSATKVNKSFGTTKQISHFQKEKALFIILQRKTAGKCEKMSMNSSDNFIPGTIVLFTTSVSQAVYKYKIAVSNIAVYNNE